MNFHKVETVNNFVFDSQDAGKVRITDCGADVFRVQVAGERWPNGSASFAELTPEEFGNTASKATLTAGPEGELTLTLDGKTLLESEMGRGFGVCKNKWLFAFKYDSTCRFYGMGEKNIGFELSNKRTKFYNTDIFGDFFWDQIDHGATDPMYAGFPVLIIKKNGLWAAVIINNPYAVFMNTGAKEDIFQDGAGPFIQELFFGSRDGEPDLYFITAQTGGALVRKLQTLLGRTPVPPLWALGHQQCRWGYRSYGDLKRIADCFEKCGIPNDGLWLDIDYMDGFRVFTMDKNHFKDPEKQIGELTDRGYKVVPILDPGFRRDDEYSVYSDAKKLDILCKTGEGKDFIGYVWPGYTVFPDFSLPEGRAFWAEQVKKFTRLGFGGYWIDMNDPATGSVPHDDMLFSRGTLRHEAWHNQYALGMAVATSEGLKAARPEKRPFVLSRSAFLSSSRRTAMWTGDNMSNEHHMKGTIALSLNLSVSGMPFNGPDVPGFALSADSDLMRAWYKLGFLFPFFRNHNIQGQIDQEPWTRDKRTTVIVGSYIRLRYKLLPYLYNLFLDQAEKGDSILRPIWYHDDSPEFEKTDDAFFVGPSILQAPFVELKGKKRSVTLPRHETGGRWYDVLSHNFRSSGDTHGYRDSPETTGIFLASPSFIPMQKGLCATNKKNMSSLDILLVLENGQKAEYTYRVDDGETEAWRDGKRTGIEVIASMKDNTVRIQTRSFQTGFGSVQARFLLPVFAKQITIIYNDSLLSVHTYEKLPFAGSVIKVLATKEVTL